MLRYILSLSLTICLATFADATGPRVFIFTDINIDAGDPDDRQSLIHLLWYADELQIEGIVPDRWNAGGAKACHLALNAYAADFRALGLQARGYPEPDHLRSLIAADIDDAMVRFRQAASAATDAPLYVLVWGNMVNFANALRSAPELAPKVRLISIGTGLMRESDIAYLPEDWERSEPCQQRNWNGEGSDAIYHDPRFRELWWLEINWTYNGMFSGPEPKEMFEKLSRFGALGQHLIEATETYPWARYFRVGDTPSVLYVIDPDHPLDDPTEASWAGRFAHPFPQQRPHYYTDASDGIDWNYADPCQSWQRAEAVFEFSKATLEAQRPEMYEALLAKLRALYDRAER